MRKVEKKKINEQKSCVVVRAKTRLHNEFGSCAAIENNFTQGKYSLRRNNGKKEIENNFNGNTATKT